MFNLSVLNDTIVFPDVSKAHPSGLLAVGGDLSKSRLIAAYSQGIFPWFDNSDPYLWWSPDPRFVLYTADFYLHKRQERSIRNSHFHITSNTAFSHVIDYCSIRTDDSEIPLLQGTWITYEMQRAYNALHDEGFAHSIEVWQKWDKQARILALDAIKTPVFKQIHGQDYVLAGGLYGVRMGQIFCGESMFHLVNDASRAALLHLVQATKKYNIPLIDCQQQTEHLVKMGAKNISRKNFITLLETGIKCVGFGEDSFLHDTADLVTS